MKAAEANNARMVLAGVLEMIANGEKMSADDADAATEIVTALAKAGEIDGRSATHYKWRIDAAAGRMGM